jgi:glycerol-3-phosphate O-acyltransferase / dihydroxyacetone phosphate acyltransferase
VFYHIVKWIVRLTLKSYFRRISITGGQHAPPKGPVIYVANHPSAFMDPMVVASFVNRPVHFLAAAEFFGTGLKSWFYQSRLNMIPVYRPTTLPGQEHKNEGVFAKCIELLERGGAILVFPEGNSVTEKRIRKLKTGVARMALGTKEATNERLNVPIVPIGLNYANPHRFQSDLLINIGKPISTNNFRNNAADVTRLTDEIETALKETVLHIQKEEHDSFIKKAELILKQKFRGSSEHVALQKKQDTFSIKQDVVRAIENLSEKEPGVIANLDRKLDQYLTTIKELGISDAAIADLSILVSVGELLRLIVAFPIFLSGYLVNVIPYYATVFYFRRLNLFERDGHSQKHKNINPAFKGSIAMAIGMVMFIVFYLALGGVAILVLKNTWAGAGLLVIAYLTGLFVMEYFRWYYMFEQKWRLRKLISERREVFASLIIDRREIIKELEALTRRTIVPKS